jgi:hypothetical protein
MEPTMLKTSYSVEQKGSIFLVVKTVIDGDSSSSDASRNRFISKAQADRMAHSLNSAQRIAADGYSVFFPGN